jgi:hypothetical protein
MRTALSVASRAHPLARTSRQLCSGLYSSIILGCISTNSTHVQCDHVRYPHHLSTGLHPQRPFKNLRTACSCDSQRHYRLSHRRRPRLFSITFNVHTTNHLLPHHPPTLRNLPRKTRPRHADRSRLETAHADGISHAHARGRWYDTRREGAG